jgi:hypothetical protein
VKGSAMGSSLIIGDLTGPTDKGWKLNYPTGFNTLLKHPEMRDNIDILISREGMRSVATAYEILESYLFNITATFLKMNPEKQTLAKKIKNYTDADLYEQVRIYRGRNNKELFKLIRLICPTFNTSETENSSNINLKDWYFTLSHVRHSIVHSLFNLNLRKANFTNYQKQILDEYFSYELDDEVAELMLSFDQANKQIVMIAEFGFMLFKSFSIEMKEDWKILKDM